MIQGVGGALLTGTPAAHATMVTDTCVTCHMGGDQAIHTFTPVVASCTACHADAENFDINGVQTTVEEKLAEVKAALQAKGLLDTEGTIVVGEYPEAQAAALWNFLFVEEDKSLGVHNADYALALLESALEALK
jgi:formate-dependent nitrite reductase cytochrome c552 subunit